jgi:hypothetical protein
MSIEFGMEYKKILLLLSKIDLNHPILTTGHVNNTFLTLESEF